MRAIVGFTLCYLLLRVSLIFAAAAALLPSTDFAIQSNQSLDLETPSLTSALSAPPFPPKPTKPLPPPAPTETRRIHCFDPDQKVAVTPNLKDCDSATEVILHHPPGPMIFQNFSSSGAQGSLKIPLSWEVRNCQITISSRKRLITDTWDMFRYVDIVVAAQNVLDVCVPRSKLALGGTEMIGDRGFYVAVNGMQSKITGNVTEDRNGTDATPMGVGTAVGIALSTAVSALVQGDELDEDVTLSVM